MTSTIEVYMSPTGADMIYLEQLKSLAFHKWRVLKVGLMIGGIPLWRLLVHDWSKFLPVEFLNYARYKYSPAKRKPEWMRAWHHHMHHNPHHPQYWVMSWSGDPAFYDGMGESVGEYTVLLPMPKTYVREMIVDMMATSMEITGSYNIAKWLNENGPSIRLHDETITRLDAVLKEVGYVLTDNCDWSWLAGRDFVFG